MSHEFESELRVVINTGDGYAYFTRRCPKCWRFVKAHKMVAFKGSQPHGPNADCKKCGPVEMPFEGYY
jgi:hypothetical protein